MPDGLGGIIRAAVRRVNASRFMIRRVKVIGLMSGTSADGVDAALVEWPDASAARPFRLLGYRETAFSRALQERIHRLAAGRVPGSEALAELASLDVLLGEQFAAAAAELAASVGVSLAAVDAIASHGQTVAHHPGSAPPSRSVTPRSSPSAPAAPLWPISGRGTWRRVARGLPWLRSFTTRLWVNRARGGWC